ncbi:MAG: hypothetical protein DI529_14885 [Chryseobacterium sp.]|nr:MAG: hypothetical protein DI529_14885 [Chryseobacterium sp.]
MDTMTHITIDCRMYGKNYGGIGRYVQEIIQNLIQFNLFSLTILANDEAYLELNNKESENLKIVKCSTKMFSLGEQLELFSKIPKCDIFWSPYINVPFLPVKAKKRVVTIHDVFHIVNPEYYSFFKRKLISLYYFFSTKLSAKIITVSYFSKSEIGNNFGENIENKTAVVYNGCDINVEGVSKKNAGIDYILFVGSVKPHKNLKKALLAFDKLNNRSIKFIIVGKKEGFVTGDDSVFEIVENINKSSPRVLFTGSINDEDLYGYYKGARMLIMPSLYEGFGLPIIEAMKFGIPVACSDIEVFHEIGDDKLFYFDPNSEDDIKLGMEKALQKDRIDYNKNILSWKNVTENIIQILLKV